MKLRRSLWVGFAATTIYLLWGFALVAGLAKGLQMRHDIWFDQPGARFEHDVSNGFYWGGFANDVGLFRVYDEVAADASGAYELDYPPLRLTVVYHWVKWARTQFPDVPKWVDSYPLTTPMLTLNTLAEAASSVLVFILITLWRARDRRRRGIESARPANALRNARRRSLRWLPGAIGALLLWMNPALLWNGHSYPQWDVWLVPFFLIAVLACSLEWWVIAGIAIAIGACLKGQMLLAAPVLLLWPLFQGRWNAAARVGAGFCFAMAVIVFPWMVPAGVAETWCIGTVIACAIAAVYRLRVRLGWKLTLAMTASIAAAICIFPTGAPAAARLMSVVLVLLTVGIGNVQRQWRAPLQLCLATAAIAMTVPLFNASTAWYDIGFAYGTRKFQFMLAGTGAYNIPTLLKNYWIPNLDPRDDVAIPWLGFTVTLTKLMRDLYLVPLVLAGVAAARNARRGDARLLLAVALPWLWFFLLMTQMHGRYLIWASAMMALLPGVDVGLTLLGVLIIAIAWMGGVHNQIRFIPGNWDADIFRHLNRIGPSMGWLVTLIGCVFSYAALVPPRRCEATVSREKTGSDHESM